MVVNVGGRVTGICAFLNDRAVEYFTQDLPECCKEVGNGKR